jgi:tRNA threonylcarbamoyladenosine biosynthesis protein TsaE
MRLAGFLEKGTVVALKGALGSGKTCFAKGMATGLGIKEELTSPTYTIISEYEAVIHGEKIPVYHIDVYRLTGNDDFTAIGGEDIVFGNGISMIEWSERIPSFIPIGALKVDIEMKEDAVRLIEISREGPYGT